MLQNNTILQFSSFKVLQIAVLLELGTALIAISMINFSLGFILSVIIVPFALLVRPNVDVQPFLSKLSR
jgi:hypothetical protein